MSIAEMETTPTPDSWRETLETVAANARATLPECAAYVDAALALVIGGAVELLNPGEAMIASQETEGLYFHVNGECDCPLYAEAPSHWCPHRIAMGLLVRTNTAMAKRLAGNAPVPVASTVHQAYAPKEETPGAREVSCSVRPRQIILAKYLQKLQGKDFVRFAGLLQMAQAEGLVSLTAYWTSNDTELSLAHAVATFADGRRYEESGDSTPQNAKNIGLHWRRMSLTRAKARCLRDALGIEECSVEEME